MYIKKYSLRKQENKILIDVYGDKKYPNHRKSAIIKYLYN